MRTLTGILLLMFVLSRAQAQFYYKDIIVNRNATETWQQFRKLGVSSVILTSFDGNGQPTPGFEGQQTIATDYSSIATLTRSTMSVASSLLTYYDNNGRLMKTVDTSDTYQSTSAYTYNAAGKLSNITNTSLETDNNTSVTEEHQWRYDDAGNVVSMLKIKPNGDTTFVSFIKDEKGNIAEEHATRKGMNLPTIFYYYDDQHRLTDIVRYNLRAQRLLPDYVFEYNSSGQLSSMLFVPEGSSDYQRWLYGYNEQGLKVKENCLNKKRELLGRIEYRYIFKR